MRLEDMRDAINIPTIIIYNRFPEGLFEVCVIRLLLLISLYREEQIYTENIKNNVQKRYCEFLG